MAIVMKNAGEMIFALLVSILFAACRCQDPCDSTVYLPISGEDSRSPDYVLDFSADLAFSDDRLEDPPKWYRILNDAGEVMPTSAPGAFHCGTWYPIWLNGNLPTDLGTTVTQSVCLQTESNICERTWNIDIRRCQENFLVYKLAQSPIIDSAYCFGQSKPCPQGTSSETGYEPCSNDYPSVVVTPVIDTYLMDGTHFSLMFNGYNREPVFECKFTEPGSNYVYDIQWYINEISIKTDVNKQYGDAETILRPRHWEESFDMNMLVKCSVRIRSGTGQTPSPRMYSDNYVAGVVPDRYVYEVNEGEAIDVKLRATVPIGCIAIGALSFCKETIKVSYPREESCHPTTTTGSAVVGENCGTDLSANGWSADREHIIKVYGNIDNMYNKESVRSSILSLSHILSNKDSSKAWEKVNIPDIRIMIKDADILVSNAQCLTQTDPQNMAFDANWYDSFHYSGEHILYRHKREPYWVHTLTSGCWDGTCNVGVAIRSHNSLFVVRTTDVVNNPIRDNFRTSFTSRTSPMIDMRDCDDQNLKVQRTGRTFHVTFPSGTYVTFYVGMVINHILIKPSVLDYQQTEGLCGFLNGNPFDDYRERSGNVINNWEQFVNSWAVTRGSSESLFTETPAFTNDLFTKRPFCVCAVQAQGRTPIADDFNTVHCNLTQPMKQCYDTTVNSGLNLYTSCSGVHQKRQADDEIIDETPLQYAEGFLERYLPPDQDWQNGWTEELAREACVNGFKNISALDLCEEYTGANKDSLVSSCMGDIKASGGTSWIIGTIQAAIVSCVIEVSRNETLMTTSTTNSSDGTFISLLDKIRSQLCLYNCSNNGVCDKTGVCVCNNGFIGEYCSQSITTPPTKMSIPGNGLCGMKSKSCTKTIVNGLYDTDQVWCRLHYFKILNNNQKEFSNTPVVIEGEYHDFSSVSCSLNSQERRKKRSASLSEVEGYKISLSYDGTNFGDEVTIMIYDESCYSCNSTTETCVLLDSCPFISTTEFVENQVTGAVTIEDTSQPSLITTTRLNKLSKKNQVSDESTLVPIVGGVAGIIAFLLVIGLIIFLKIKAKKHTKCEDDNSNPNVPPTTTYLSSKIPKQEGSFLNLDVQWVDQRSPTPDHLFVVNNRSY